MHSFQGPHVPHIEIPIVSCFVIILIAETKRGSTAQFLFSLSFFLVSFSQFLLNVNQLANSGRDYPALGGDVVCFFLNFFREILIYAFEFNYPPSSASTSATRLGVQIPDKLLRDERADF